MKTIIDHIPNYDFVQKKKMKAFGFHIFIILIFIITNYAKTI